MKRHETMAVWRHWFGRSLWLGKPSNSPDGVNWATPTESHKAVYLPTLRLCKFEHSMKLFVCVCVRVRACACVREVACIGSVFFM